MSWTCANYRRKELKEATDLILERSANREKFFALAIKMLAIAKGRGLRLIMENPWSRQTYLKSNFVMPPTMIDNNRRLRGDFFEKPTAYWFINCQPTIGLFREQKALKNKRIVDCRPSIKAGLCSEERSMISPDYARNFICDFILGKEQRGTQLSLYDIGNTY